MSVCLYASLFASHFVLLLTAISTNWTTLLQLSALRRVITVTFYHYYHCHSDQFTIIASRPHLHNPNHYNLVLITVTLSLFSLFHYHIILALVSLPLNIFYRGQCQCSSHFPCPCHHSVCTTTILNYCYIDPITSPNKQLLTIDIASVTVPLLIPIKILNCRCSYVTVLDIANKCGLCDRNCGRMQSRRFQTPLHCTRNCSC